MKDRFLTSGVVVLIVVLAAALILPDRSISRFMESCGEVIANTFGF